MRHSSPADPAATFPLWAALRGRMPHDSPHPKVLQVLAFRGARSRFLSPRAAGAGNTIAELPWRAPAPVAEAAAGRPGEPGPPGGVERSRFDSEAPVHSRPADLHQRAGHRADELPADERDSGREIGADAPPAPARTQPPEGGSAAVGGPGIAESTPVLRYRFPAVPGFATAPVADVGLPGGAALRSPARSAAVPRAHPAGNEFGRPLRPVPDAAHPEVSPARVPGAGPDPAPEGDPVQMFRDTRVVVAVTPARVAQDTPAHQRVSRAATPRRRAARERAPVDAPPDAASGVPLPFEPSPARSAAELAERVARAVSRGGDRPTGSARGAEEAVRIAGTARLPVTRSAADQVPLTAGSLLHEITRDDVVRALAARMRAVARDDRFRLGELGARRSGGG